MAGSRDREAICRGEIAGVGAYTIIPLALGQLTIPVGTPMEGRTIAVRGFVVTHRDGVLLFDTGFGAEFAEGDALLQAKRDPLDTALATAGFATNDITAVANCHWHYDHCGGNPTFPGVPTYVQRREYEGRHELKFFLPERVEFAGSDLRIIDGETEVLPGVRLVLTPGHTAGHQSLVIDDDNGPVVLAGQAAYTAEEFEDPRREPARGWKTAWDGDAFLASIGYLKSLRPRRVYFSHDVETWPP